MSGQDKFVIEFEKLRPAYEQFTAKIEYLLTELLQSIDLDYTLEFRTNTVESFKEKIVRKSYENHFRQIQDFSGLRIILRRPSDIHKVASLIERVYCGYKKLRIQSRTS
jgi:ppGpp synthetase/RelA/SpoT-type nucleotidyltranferase